MKNVLITCRSNYNKHGELIWTLENNWYEFFKRRKVNLIPITPSKRFKDQLKQLKPRGIIFSGGNDLNFLNKNKANLARDRFELKLLKIALKNKLPILGVCRGFQLIAYFYKSKIFKKNNHVRKIHTLKFNRKIKEKLIKTIKVNSFHNFVISNLPKIFDFIVRDKDQTIELAYSKKLKILNTMFHPERKNGSQNYINQLVFSHFKI